MNVRSIRDSVFAWYMFFGAWDMFFSFSSQCYSLLTTGVLLGCPNSSTLFLIISSTVSRGPSCSQETRKQRWSSWVFSVSSPIGRLAGFRKCPLMAHTINTCQVTKTCLISLLAFHGNHSLPPEGLTFFNYTHCPPAAAPPHLCQSSSIQPFGHAFRFKMHLSMSVSFHQF